MQQSCKLLSLTMNFQRISKSLDYAGITASAMCAIHCASMPILITSLPLVGLTFLADGSVELILLLISLSIGLLSLGSSYFNVHKDVIPILLFLCGFLFILTGHFSYSDVIELILFPIGGFFLIMAHYYNLKKVKLAY